MNELNGSVSGFWACGFFLSLVDWKKEGLFASWEREEGERVGGVEILADGRSVSASGWEERVWDFHCGL